MEATESDALDVIDILRYAMIDTIEDSYLTPKLCSDGKLTNRKVNFGACIHVYVFARINKIYRRFNFGFMGSLLYNSIIRIT